MLIHETPFVIVDTETTGTNAKSDRVIEIAAVKVLGGQVVDTFSQLINPERSVPRRITQLTGISTAMVFDQPTAAQVMQRFLKFLSDGVFVAHNLTFDQRFVNAELARIGKSPLNNESLCTLRLARRLLPGLRSKGLSSLVDHYKLVVDGRHRALGDAGATAEIFIKFISQVAFEHEIETLDELLHFQHRKYNDLRKGPKHLQRIRKDVLPQLPDLPGVYFMHDRHDAIIYIGKAKSLRSRVRSYFTGIEGHPERTRKLVHTVRNVTWTETGSELAALLLESRLIKEHKPRFNRALRRYRNRPFIRLDVTHAIPRITLSSYLLDDGAEYFGPTSGRRQAELVVDIINQFYLLRECDDDTFRMGRRCLYGGIGRCPAPCVNEEAARTYDAEVQRVRDFLTGQDRSVLDEIEARMKAAAAEMDFEQAAEYRDWLRRLGRMSSKQEAIAAPVLEHNAVLVLPGTLPETRQGYLVRFGRHVDTVTLSQPPTPEEETHLRERLTVHFDPDQPRPERYFKKEVEEVRLLAHWLYVHRDSALSVQWDAEQSHEAFLEAILSAAHGPLLQEEIET